MNRRDFLKTIGVSTGAAALTGCDQPVATKIVSSVTPSDTLPGEAKLVRSVCTECPAGCEMTIKIRDGQPIKCEGQLCIRGQASIGRLYHPDRITAPMFRGQKISWEEAIANIEGALGKPGPHAFLSGRTTGATSELIEGFCQKRNIERLPEFEVYSYAAIRKANEIVFGKPVVPFYDVAKADLLITVGVDVIETFANPVQFARDLAEAKLHWIHAEPHLSLTGINADERIVIPPGGEAEFLASERVATALKNAKRPLIIANGAAALAAAKLQKEHNSPLDFDRGLDYSRVGTAADLDKLRERTFGVLFIHNTDPAAYRPSFAEMKAAFRVGIGDVMNETLKKCDLVLPLSDALQKIGAERRRPGGSRSDSDRRDGGVPAAEVRHGPSLVIVPSIRTFDGRGDVLPLLSEIPDPLTTVTYGPWVTVSEKFGAKDGELVEFTVAGKTLRMPARVMPGQPANVFTVQRPFLKGIALPLATNGEEQSVLALDSVRATGTKAELPVLSGGMRAEGRGILPEHKHEHGDHHANDSLYPPHEHKHYRWAMAVDLDRCTGCAACVAACYVENNIPVVGPKEHLAGREMSWLRLEPFVNDHNEYELLPMMCQQCDHAPCEPVCPVLATYHNPEGLNAQVYNRCVGTRYCANNCPFKVRRFNWISHPLENPTNPDVSRRPRGVMEKCTFCVHRIVKAKDHAKDEKRLVRDGEITTACAQTCPAQAIVFGNMMDEHSRVHELAHEKRAYRVFEELGTQPSVYYLKTTKHEA